MKQFGFPEVARGGDGGGGGGGGDSEDAMDAYGLSMDLPEIDVIGGQVEGALAGPSGFDAAYGVDSFSDASSLGLTSDNFSDPGQLGANAYTGGFGFGLDGVPAQDFAPSNFADRGAPVWGFSNNPRPGVEIVSPDQFNRIDAQAPGSIATNFALRGDAFADRFGGPQGPAQGFASPFNEPSRGLPQQLFDDRFVGLPGRGLSPWAPGPSIGQVAVSPSQSTPGAFSHAPGTPPGATPTQAFGLPAAAHPGFGPQELDWNAIAGSGIESMLSNTRGFVSPEGIANQQAQHVPQPMTMAGGQPAWFSQAQGFVDPGQLEADAAYNRPYQMARPDGTQHWFSNQRGFIGDDDPDVQAMIARMNAPQRVV